MEMEVAIEKQAMTMLVELKAELDKLKAENAQLRKGAATKPSTIDGRKTASHNWNMTRDRTDNKDELIITISLLDGQHDVSQGGKHSAVTSVRNIPFKFGDEGDVQVLPARQGFKENEYMISLYVGKRVDR